MRRACLSGIPRLANAYAGPLTWIPAVRPCRFFATGKDFSREAFAGARREQIASSSAGGAIEAASVDDALQPLIRTEARAG